MSCLFLRPGPWQFEIWQYGQINNIFVFRIWDAQFEIFRFEIMKTDRIASMFMCYYMFMIIL